MATSKLYALNATFEKVVVAAVITDPKFMARIGSALEAAAMPTESARLIVSCALVYLKETGRPLTSAAALSQRLRTLMDKGTLLKEDSLNAVDFLDECLAVEAPDREEIIHELATVVKRHREGLILEKADKLYSKNASITEIREELAELDKLGVAVENPTVAADSAFTMIREMKRVSRLTTGCQELDALLQGGLARGQMGFALGQMGSGKSQYLSQIAQAGVCSMVNTLVATLEINTGDWWARVIAGVTEIPQRAISDGSMIDDAQNRYQKLVRDGRIGELRIRDFPAKTTQIEEIFAWVEEQNTELQSTTGGTYELIVIDYLDKVGYPMQFGNAYTGMEHVYEVARTSTYARNMWLWSASQAKGGDKKSKALMDADDAADSRNKGRVTDVCVTLNLSEDHTQANIFLAKNRTGEGRQATGMLPTDFAFGRFTRPSTPSLFAPPKMGVRPGISKQGDFDL